MINYTNKEILELDLTFNDKNIEDPFGNRVMMEWEDEIMKDAANLICRDGGKILNIGFGMGLIDNYIQLNNIKEHWIIEAHPQVIAKMKQDKWDKKPNVNCIFNDWRNVINDLPKFDGIYFDTWADNQGDLLYNLDKILNPGGKFSTFSYSPSVFYKKYTIEEHETKLKKIPSNQLAGGKYYFKPTNKNFKHKLIIKNK